MNDYGSSTHHMTTPSPDDIPSPMEPDDLTIISSFDDDLPSADHAHLPDLLDDFDIIDHDHILHQVSASPSLAP